MARLTGGRLHVLHVVQLSEFNKQLPAGFELAALEGRRTIAQEQLLNEIESLALETEPEVTVSAGRPSETILQEIDRHGLNWS